jgi:hypothetical protein
MGGYSKKNTWIVYFMENPPKKWMIKWENPPFSATESPEKPRKSEFPQAEGSGAL